MRQALGRGLDALIPNAPEKAHPGEGGGIEVKKIPIDLVRQNRLQPRKNFDAEKLSELAQSIKENGLAQPIIVSYDKTTNSYELVAGERRLRASQLAGEKEIEAIVREPLEDKKRLVLAMIENLQREGLNPIEEALGYLKLMEDFDINQTKLTELVGKSKSAISNTMRLLELPDEVQKALQFGELAEGHARALLMIKNKAEIMKVFHVTIAQKLSVRQVEDMARKIEAGKMISAKEPKKKLADIRALEESIQQTLGTRVEIRPLKNPARGTVVLHYFSLADFDKILDRLKK